MTEIELSISITEVDADQERVEELTSYLRRDLLELGAELVEQPAGEDLPAGVKGQPLVELGILALVTISTLLPGLITFLQAWVQQGEERAVTIRTPAGLEVTFVPEKILSEAELLSLVEKLAGMNGSKVAAVGLEPSQQPNRAHLRQILAARFDEGELRTLSFDLGVAYDNLPGQGKANKARDLVSYLERHGRLDDLLEIGSRQRPDIVWEPQ